MGVARVARNEKGESVRSRLTTPEGNTLTAMTAVDIAERVASGDFKPGFQTPSELSPIVGDGLIVQAAAVAG